MEHKGLLFIPDISGFTRFVNEIELAHSRYIIQQLLEVLINANQTGLEIAEIEGDAILFYKFGEPVNLGVLYSQVEKMFCAFHQYLAAYDHRKICQCKACVSAASLTLKVISHYGEFATYNIKQFKKLIGKDVIVAHQLLKNDIEQHEYWLVTQNLLADKQPEGTPQWMRWENSIKQTEAGDINFHYAQLGHLKNQLPSHHLQQLEPADKVKIITVSRVYAVDIKTLCFTVVHFEYRHLWQEGIEAIDEVEHFLPGVGSRHRLVLKNGQVEMVHISSFAYNPEAAVVFSETDEKKKTATCFTIEKINDNTSRLTIDIYLQRNTARLAVYRLTKKAEKERELRQSLENLDGLVKKMELPLEF